MAPSDTRYSVYPAPKAVEIVGDNAPALNQAIEWDRATKQSQF